MLRLGDIGRNRGEGKISPSYTNRLASYAVKGIFTAACFRKCPFLSKIPKQKPRPATRAAYKSKGSVVYLCFINQCPIDIILMIAEYLQLGDLNAFLRTSRDFYAVIGIPFYNRAINHRCSPVPSIIEWATWNNQPTLIQKFQIPQRREAFSTETKNKALGMAALWGHLSIIVPLLEMGAEITSMDYVCRVWPARGFTPLHHAARHGHPATIELLLEHGADSETLSFSGKTALQCAVENHHEACVRILVEKGTNVEFEDLLESAIKNRNSNMVRLLLQLGANPSSPGPRGSTPCFSAMMKPHLPILEVLLEMGADPDCAYRGESKTLLHHAVEQGKARAAKLLLKYHANISATDNNGLQPLHYATRGGQFEPQPEIALLLLEEGAHKSTPDNSGYTAVDYALCSGVETTMEMLMQEQAEQSLLRKVR